MATPNQKNLVSLNEKYASNFKDGDLATPPSKKYLVVTCMDSRIFPSKCFGIDIGEAHIIRNAGGNAKDALRSILISQHMLGTREVILIKHTRCGMLTFSNEDARGLVEKNGSKVDSDYDFQPWGDLEKAVKDDVQYLKGQEGLIKGTEVSGWVYEVESGKVKHIV